MFKAYPLTIMKATVAKNNSGAQLYPGHYETTVRFAGCPAILFRPIKPADSNLLLEFFHSHSEQTILHRYFIPLHDLPPELLHQFVNVDYHNDMAIVSVANFEGRKKMLCVGRYCRNPDGKGAEIAITVHDQWQRRGIGTFLFRLLTKIARENEITTFTADVMADNHGMLSLIRNGANHLVSTLEAGVWHMSFTLNNCSSKTTCSKGE